MVFIRHCFAIAEYSNNRVLFYNQFPTGGVPADLVLGQPDMTSSAAGTASAQKLGFLVDVFSDGQRLFVTEYNRNRLLIWNSIPTQNYQAADVVLGQTSMTTTSAGTGLDQLHSPIGVRVFQGRLFVADTLNHRILIWNTIPTVNAQPADLVLGTGSSGTSATQLFNPSFIESDGQRLFVSEQNNHRVSVWNSLPTTNNQPIDYVLGQPNLTSGTSNNGLPNPTAQTLSRPEGLLFDGRRLIVSDRLNHRVLIWNSVPTVMQQAADLVLGQPDMVSNTLNNGGLSAASINLPIGLATVNGSGLAVADSNNCRILIWNSMPTTIRQPADQVIGQTSMTSTGCSATASNINAPQGIFSTGLLKGVRRPGGY